MTDIARELREDYPAVDVTTVVFSRDFAGVGCCVIPQDKVLAIAAEIEEAEKALLELCSRLGFATGHGDTLADIIREIDGQIRSDRVGGTL